jgi:REP element-mobilizing transposase RayT
MARLGRYFVPDQPLHIIQRGNDRKAVFFSADGFCAMPRLADHGSGGGRA